VKHYLVKAKARGGASHAAAGGREFLWSMLLCVVMHWRRWLVSSVKKARDSDHATHPSSQGEPTARLAPQRDANTHTSLHTPTHPHIPPPTHTHSRSRSQNTPTNRHRCGRQRDGRGGGGGWIRYVPRYGLAQLCASSCSCSPQRPPPTSRSLAMGSSLPAPLEGVARVTPTPTPNP